MSAYITIAKRAKAVEAHVVVCAECGDVITGVLDGQKKTDEWFVQACLKARLIVKTDRPCKRHNKKGRARSI